MEKDNIQIRESLVKELTSALDATHLQICKLLLDRTSGATRAKKAGTKHSIT